jgi:hypothetical protein
MRELNRPWIFAGATSLVLQVVLTGLFIAFLAGCSSSQKSQEPAAAQELEEEVKLKSDRSELDEIRQQVPEDIKSQNDELAFTLGLTAEGKKSPTEIWSKFNDAVRKRRETFDKQEKKREEYLGAQKKNREKFFAKKVPQDERQSFSNEQDSKRREFFDDERDKRKDFESNLREKRSDFEAYLREKRSNFDNEMKAYTKTFYDRKREESAVQRAKAKKEQEARRAKQQSAEASNVSGAAAAFGVPASAQGPIDPDLEDFKNLPKGKATPLQPTTEE